MKTRNYQRISWPKLQGELGKVEGGRKELDSLCYATGDALKVGLEHTIYDKEKNPSSRIPDPEKLYEFERGLYRRIKELQHYVRQHAAQRTFIDVNVTLKHVEGSDFDKLYGVAYHEDVGDFWPPREFHNMEENE